MSLTVRENTTCHILNEHHAAYFGATNKCAPHFDRSLCWYNVSFGDIGYRDCPFTFCTSVPGCERVAFEHRASRVCTAAGTWNVSVYDKCLEILEHHQHCISGFCHTCPDPLREAVINVSLALSVISVGLLVAALVLFSLFDSIQCRRLSIHKNLALAFVFRFTVLALWTVTNTSNLFRDCSQYTPMPLKSLEWLCKGILWLVIYFQVASVMWMLIEGIYLYSRFTVFAMRYGEAPYSLYLLSGWGFPFVVVMIWTGVHEYHSSANNLYCWLPYAQGVHLWILAGTMGAALLLNVVVLLAIVIILAQKLRSDTSSQESKKIWKTVKATILLVPLLGISNIPLFYEPSKPTAAYMLTSAILQHSQGIFIAVLYCFLNSEIQNAIRRQLTKLPFSSQIRSRISSMHRVRFETERTYIADPSQTPHNRSRSVPMEEMSGKNGIPPGVVVAHHTNGTNGIAATAPVSAHSSPMRTAMRTGSGEELCDENTRLQF